MSFIKEGKKMHSKYPFRISYGIAFCVRCNGHVNCEKMCDF